MLKKRKGQVTLFLLVGLILLFILIFVFSLIYSISKEKIKANQEVLISLDSKAQAMKIVIEQCIEDVGESALITVGYRGGRDSIEKPFFESDTLIMNYNYYLGKSKAPSLEDMESNLETLVNNNIPQCVETSLEERDGNILFQGASVELGISGTDVQITDTFVLFTLNWPITLSMEGAEKQLEKFTPIKIPIRLNKISSVTDAIVWQLTINPYFIDAFYLLDQELSFDISLFSTDTYVFIITDSSSTPFGKFVEEFVDK